MWSTPAFLPQFKVLCVLRQVATEEQDALGYPISTSSASKAASPGFQGTPLKLLADSTYMRFGTREGMHLHLTHEIVVQTTPTGVAFGLFPSACLQSEGEHSSFDELQALVRDIRPRRLIPTVNSEPWAEKTH